jgi:hypothetical protein
MFWLIGGHSPSQFFIMEEVMDISKLDKADVLATLYNRAMPLGMGMLHYTPEPMTREEAQVMLDESRDKYFDYVKGRVMKIDLSKDELRTALFNRDNGPDAAENALAGLSAYGL